MMEEGNSIFRKILNLLKHIFHREEKPYLLSDINGECVKEETKNNFLEEIKKIHSDEDLLLKLQADFENGKILEDDLTEDEKAQLKELYNNQIENTKARIYSCKNDILEMMKKLENI